MADPWNPSTFDPHAPDFLADPFPNYANFRDQAPVYWVEEYQSWWVFRYGDVKLVLDAFISRA